jgi:tetratricopeptide (TPR) repeat protein
MSFIFKTMRHNKIKFLVFIFFLISVVMNAQTTKDLEEEANFYFVNKEYNKAYDLFDKLHAKNPKLLDYKFKLGYCCLFYPEKKARAIEIFEDIRRTEKKAEDVEYYLGKAYHINYRFDDAIKSFETYMAQLGTKIKDADKPFYDDAMLSIQNCKNGKELIEKKVIAEITNLGSPLNTEDMEYVPVITADESILIYTYVGKKSLGGKINDDLVKDEAEGYYHEDVYMSTRGADSAWSEPVGISSINTKGNDAAIAISPDGQTLFTFTSTDKDKGDIYSSTLNGSEWTKPERLNKNINTIFWEGSCSLSADGRYLYFASEREGGVGGRDIWLSEKVNGDWAPAVNLGPRINTIHDEDAPFIHPDGITMIFSSKGHQSIGGYDIMFTIKKDNEWVEPRSMGIPLNTTEDDRYYVINAKGDKGFFSSNRGAAGGKGKQDLYVVTPGILGEKPVIAMLKGNIYGDDKPVEGKIEVYKVSTSTVIGPYYSNSKTGKYLLALSPGSVYKIKVMANGYDPVEEELDIESLSQFLEVRKDFYLYTPGKTPTVKDTTPIVTTTTAPTTTTTAATDPTVTPKADPCAGAGPAPDFTALKGKSLNNIEVYKQLLSIAGTYCAEKLIFKVQIAAYRHPENYKYGHLMEFGNPEIVPYPDGITRFTQMQFKTLNEAEAQRQKAIAKGQPDAWVVGFIDGKRYTLEELIMLDFFSKSIN